MRRPAGLSGPVEESSLRVVLCGTLYGAAYVRALAPSPWPHPDGLRLVGVLARGSERSRLLASQLAVPLYREPREVPAGGVDLACVAVSGEAGCELALGFLRRGAHVLLEHPVTEAALAALLAEAAGRRLVLHVNAHYGDCEVPQRFLAHCAALRPRMRLRHLSLATNSRALYSGLDLVARALGGLDTLQFHGAAADAALPAEAPLLSIDGTAAGVAVTVQCLRLDTAGDDGSGAWVSHRLTATFEEGTLFLGEASGPLLWIPAIAALGGVVSTGAAGAGVLSWPAWSDLSPPPAPPTVGAFFCWQRDQANRFALHRLVRQARSGAIPAEQQPAHLLAVSRAWDAAIARLRSAGEAPASWASAPRSP